MNDLISRQAAISHVDDVSYIKEHPNVGLLWKAWIESLPSAQPEPHEERTETHACDLISRQAAIDAINQICPIDTEYDCTLLDRVDVRCVLTDLPSAQPEQRWIPCSERLPEENEYVLACGSQGTMRVCYYHINDTFYSTEYADLNKTGWYDEVDDALYFEPIAWRPLPDKYKAESEGDE